MDIWNLIYERKSFFIDLCLEHLMISAIAIVIAIAAGGLIGILLSEYPRFSRPVIGVVNFLYTIPSISMLGFLIHCQASETLQLFWRLPSMPCFRW